MNINARTKPLTVRDERLLYLRPIYPRTNHGPFIPNNVNEFMKEQPVRERLVGDHRVHEGYCGHVRKVRQRTRFASYLQGFPVERGIADALSGNRARLMVPTLWL